MDFLLGGLSSGVGLKCQLIHVIADGVQFPEQGGVGVGRPGAKSDAHNKLPEHGFDFESGGLGCLRQPGIVSSVQTQSDSFIRFHSVVSSPLC